MPLYGKPDIVEDALHLGRRNAAGGWNPPPGRKPAPSLRCACPLARARAGGIGRYRCRERSRWPSHGIRKKADAHTARNAGTKSKRRYDQRGEQQFVAQAQALETALEAAAGADERIARSAAPMLRAGAADTAPAWGPASATEGRRRAWRRPPLPPAAQTGSALRRPGRTWAETRCRCRWWTPAPARRSAPRRRESPARIGLPSSRLRLMFSIFHRGVVHQNSDRQRQPAQRHDVDGLAQRAQHQDRGENRKRNGNRDDQRAAPASQEHQDHDRR